MPWYTCGLRSCAAPGCAREPAMVTADAPGVWCKCHLRAPVMSEWFCSVECMALRERQHCAVCVNGARRRPVTLCGVHDAAVPALATASPCVRCGMRMCQACVDEDERVVLAYGADDHRMLCGDCVCALAHAWLGDAVDAYE